MTRSIEDYLLQIIIDGYYTCECGNNVEPDGECYCGIPNPISDWV